ncbi:MAG: AmmeMemoRadiSam system protein B [Theionarchaea archaeon]|nr:AmmeMemoRadiSam system protein B [Theionarchaea archaeon]
MIRRSVVAGTFYPGTHDQLHETVQSYFNTLGGLPEPGTPRSIGGLVPHAGYLYSGQVAAYTFHAFRKQLPETFIIMGPNHTGLGSGVAIMTFGSWETPLGTIEIDSEMAKQLYEACEIMDDDKTAHSREHSIEVQLPFLQYIGGKTFVPISMGMQDSDSAQEVGEAIATVCKNRSVGILVSSDLTHFGAGYGFVPSVDDPLKWMECVDTEILTAITSLSPERIYKAAKETTACGYGCIASMIIACKSLGLTTGSILEYRTSYDVSKDSNHIVGYGSAIITG